MSRPERRSIASVLRKQHRKSRRKPRALAKSAAPLGSGAYARKLYRCHVRYARRVGREPIPRERFMAGERWPRGRKAT